MVKKMIYPFLVTKNMVAIQKNLNSIGHARTKIVLGVEIFSSTYRTRHTV